MSNNTTVPAVVINRQCFLGYGTTGKAQHHEGDTWRFWPDSEQGPFAFREDELFFPPLGRAPEPAYVFSNGCSVSDIEALRSAYCPTPAPDSTAAKPITTMTDRRLLERIHSMLVQLLDV